MEDDEPWSRSPCFEPISSSIEVLYEDLFRHCIEGMSDAHHTLSPALTSSPSPPVALFIDQESPYDTPPSRTRKRKQATPHSNSPPNQEISKAETALSYFQDSFCWLKVYKRHQWVFTPVTPAALTEDFLRHLLCTQEGEGDHSIRALSTYSALAITALQFGKEDIARQFHERGRQCLEHVFDRTDYHVAEALLARAVYLMLLDPPLSSDHESTDAARIAYYLTLAMEICDRTQMLNSTISLVSIYCMSIYEMRAGRLTPARLQNSMLKFYAYQQQYPFTSPYLDQLQASQEEVAPTDIQSARPYPEVYYNRKRSRQNQETFSGIAFGPKVFSAILLVVRNLLIGTAQLYFLSMTMQQLQSLTVRATPSSWRDPNELQRHQELTTTITRVKADLEQLVLPSLAGTEQLFSPTPYFVRQGMTLAIYAIRTGVHRAIGNLDEALFWAKHFLALYVTERVDGKLVYHALHDCLAYVVEVFMENQMYREARQCLGIFENVADQFPLYKHVLEKYKTEISALETAEEMLKAQDFVETALRTDQGESEPVMAEQPQPTSREVVEGQSEEKAVECIVIDDDDDDDDDDEQEQEQGAETLPIVLEDGFGSEVRNQSTRRWYSWTPQAMNFTRKT